MSCLDKLNLEFVKGTALKASDLNVIVEKINEIIQDICENGEDNNSGGEDTVERRLLPSLGIWDSRANNAGTFVYGMLYINPQGNLFENEIFPYIATIYPHSTNSTPDKWLGSDYTLQCTSFIYQDIEQDFQLFKNSDREGDFIIFRTPSTYQVLNDPRRYIINDKGERRYAYYGADQFRLGDADNRGTYYNPHTLTKYTQALTGEWGGGAQYQYAVDLNYTNYYNNNSIVLYGALPILGVFTYGGTKCIPYNDPPNSGKHYHIKLQLSSTEGEKFTDEVAQICDYPVYTQGEPLLALICGIIPKSYYDSVLNTTDADVTPGNISTVVEEMLLNDYDPRIALINQKMNEDFLKSVILASFGGRAQLASGLDENISIYYRFESEDGPTKHNMHDIFVEIAAPFIEDCFGPKMPWEEETSGWEYTEEEGKIVFTGTKWTDKSYRQIVKDRVLGTNKSYIKYGSDWASGANKGVRKAVHDMWDQPFGEYDSEERFNYLIARIKQFCPSISFSSTSYNIENTYAEQECLYSVKAWKVGVAYKFQTGEEYSFGIPSFYDQYITNVWSRWHNMMITSITDLPLLGQYYCVDIWSGWQQLVTAGAWSKQLINSAYGDLHNGDLLICMRHKNSTNAHTVADVWLNDTNNIRGNEGHVVLSSYFGFADSEDLHTGEDGEVKNIDTTISYQESISDDFGIGIGTIERFGGDYNVGTFRAKKDIEVSEIRFNTLYTWHPSVENTPYGRNPYVWYLGESIETYYGAIGSKSDWY